jgi:hypothetical protein
MQMHYIQTHTDFLSNPLNPPKFCIYIYSRRGHCCSSIAFVVSLCVVLVAASWSLVQRSPTVCVCVCVHIYTSILTVVWNTSIHWVGIESPFMINLVVYIVTIVLWRTKVSLNYYECLESAFGFLGALAKLRKATNSFFVSIRPSVRPHGTAGLTLEIFSLNFTFAQFSKICRESSGVITIWQ